MTMRPPHLANPAAFVWSYHRNDRLIAACARTQRSHGTLGDKQPLYGKDIERRAKRSSAGVRAAMAARLVNGAVAILKPTPAQIAMLTRLHPSTISLATHLPPEDLDEVRRGRMSLRQARARRRKPAGRRGTSIRHRCSTSSKRGGRT